MADYKNLIAWQEAVELTVDVYILTKQFPQDERFGLVSQMRRAAVSVPSNIAEGAGRYGTKDTAKFWRIARGSLQELETQMILGERLGFVSSIACSALSGRISTVQKLLHGLIRKHESRLT